MNTEDKYIKDRVLLVWYFFIASIVGAVLTGKNYFSGITIAGVIIAYRTRKKTEKDSFYALQFTSQIKVFWLTFLISLPTVGLMLYGAHHKQETLEMSGIIGNALVNIFMVIRSIIGVITIYKKKA